MAGVVLDASAVLALIRAEPGSDRVEELIGQGIISAVNLQEVIKELLVSGLALEGIETILDELRLDLRSHDRNAAYAATKRYGRGLGDRSCMALGIALNRPVVTADREWRNVSIEGLELLHIR